jgi:hypothetical protein
MDEALFASEYEAPFNGCQLTTIEAAIHMLADVHLNR